VRRIEGENIAPLQNVEDAGASRHPESPDDFCRFDRQNQHFSETAAAAFLA
jgi:hypothetical protein